MGGWYSAGTAGADRPVSCDACCSSTGRAPTSYDFGPGHPLTPRRFGPGIDLLRAVGAEPGLAPEPAPDDELLWCHTPPLPRDGRGGSRGARSAVRRRGSARAATTRRSPGCTTAAAVVAGGSLRAMEAILRGDVEHAFHPGGGLHHAMPDRASGFCIYDDPALAIARARRDGLRVLYVDLDVHHGDGVQAIHWADPGVLTLSIHETGPVPVPGDRRGGGAGRGRRRPGRRSTCRWSPGPGEGAWLAAVRALLPELAAAFGPDLIVSQHGADSHAWDPLAHLRVTTTAMGEAARLVDRVAHRYAGGRWLATGGGGYDVYRVVPRIVEPRLAGRRAPRRARRDARRRGASAGRPRRPATASRRSPRRSTTRRTPGCARDASQAAAEARSRETAGARSPAGRAAPAAGGARPRLVGSARRRAATGPAAGPSTADGTGRRRRRRSSPRSTPRPGIG